MSARRWRDAVLYQVYPGSFADANGDGIGDLAGSEPARIEDVRGSVMLSTGGSREHEAVSGTLALAPGEGVVLVVDARGSARSRTDGRA